MDLDTCCHKEEAGSTHLSLDHTLYQQEEGTGNLGSLLDILRYDYLLVALILPLVSYSFLVYLGAFSAFYKNLGAYLWVLLVVDIFDLCHENP